MSILKVDSKKLIAERRVVVVVVGWNTQHQMVIMWHNGSHDVVFCDKIRDWNYVSFEGLEKKRESSSLNSFWLSSFLWNLMVAFRLKASYSFEPLLLSCSFELGSNFWLSGSQASELNGYSRARPESSSPSKTNICTKWKLASQWPRLITMIKNLGSNLWCLKQRMWLYWLRGLGIIKKVPACHAASEYKFYFSNSNINGVLLCSLFEWGKIFLPTSTVGNVRISLR